MPKSTNKTRGIYLDYVAATPINPAVFSAMQKVYKDNFANVDSIHDFGVQARRVLAKAKREVAEILKAQSGEIIFTSGSTESNNLAILGVLGACGEKSPHIVTTNIEHPSVLEICKHLEKTKQARVTYVPAEANGLIDPRKLKKALRPNTILVSVMYANGEIGTVEPLKEIAKEIRHYNKTNDRKIYFHTDATQAISYLPIEVPKLGVDLMSFSSTKFYGPKGVGVLYVKKGTVITGVMFGGDQQSGLRPGSYNLPGIVGLAEALKITEEMKTKESERLTKLRDYFFYQLTHSNVLTNDRIIINGDLENRLPNNINITIPNIPSDLLVIELSAEGIMASAKSACKAGDGKASHVITAIRNKDGLPAEAEAKAGSLRLSFGRGTKKEDIDHTLKVLAQILTKLKKWYN